MSQAQELTQVSRQQDQARYDSILVHVQPGLTSSRRTEIAALLARRFDARLIGLGAEAIEPPPVDPYSGALVGEWMSAMQAQVVADLKSAEEAFGRDAAGVATEWRAVQDLPAQAVARASRAADLIVAGGVEPSGDAYRNADPADLALQSGRPVLVVPVGATHLHAKSIVVAWKDTREARRAVADALPFLVRAEDVVVMSVCAQDGVETAETQTDDVAQALRRRGVPARSYVVAAPEGSVPDELNAEAAAIGADLIVMGAYGHSRVREWILGGATRDLLRSPLRHLLLSH